MSCHDPLYYNIIRMLILFKISGSLEVGAYPSTSMRGELHQSITGIQVPSLLVSFNSIYPFLTSYLYLGHSCSSLIKQVKKQWEEMENQDKEIEELIKSVKENQPHSKDEFQTLVDQSNFHYYHHKSAIASIGKREELELDQMKAM